MQFESTSDHRLVALVLGHEPAEGQLAPAGGAHTAAQDLQGTAGLQGLDDAIQDSFSVAASLSFSSFCQVSG